MNRRDSICLTKVTAQTFGRWNYGVSLLLVTIVTLLGFPIQYFLGSSEGPLLMWPENALLLGIFVTILVMLHLARLKLGWISFLDGVPFAIASIVVFLSLSFFAGVVPQTDNVTGLTARLGLNRLATSWPFLFSTVLLLTSLGLTVISRFRAPIRNWGFLANHFGLWLIIAGNLFGSSEFVRLRINLVEGETTRHAADTRGGIVPLPFAIKLNDFVLDEYPADIAQVSPLTNKIKSHKSRLIPAVEGSNFSIDQWNFTVLDYLPNAVQANGKFVLSLTTRGIPAVKLKWTDSKTSLSTEQWIAVYQPSGESQLVSLDEDTALALLPPRPQKFTSNVSIHVPHQTRIENVEIAVNKPLVVGNWRFYQSDYDQLSGKWSKTSGLEAIIDPWLPMVYAGIWLMLLGTFYLMFGFKKYLIREGAC